MIVCWVLFAIPAVVSLASWPMYFKYGSEVEALKEEPWKPFDPEAAAEEFLQEKNAPGNPFTEAAAQRYNKAIRVGELEGKENTWGMAAFASVGIAAAILLWNILCHTIAWVLVGRKKNENNPKQML